MKTMPATSTTCVMFTAKCQIIVFFVWERPPNPTCDFILLHTTCEEGIIWCVVNPFHLPVRDLFLLTYTYILK